MHLYVHVPFCARRCTYCDFAIAVRREVPSDQFARAILAEWAAWQGHPAWQAAPLVETIYFGGGTPSHVEPGSIGRILSRVASDRAVAPDAEITLEANPDDVTPAAAAAWRAVGINRISLGAQSFDPAVLGWMHRTHSAGQIGEAVEALRAADLDDVSLDLIFGLPAALGRDWHRDLELAMALEPGHLSLYGLTIEDHTALGRWAAAGRITPVDEQAYAFEFLEAHEAISAAGYVHYEVSNAAKPGHRARHNSAYWRRAAYIGLGPSAHSGFGAERRWNLREWQAYADAPSTALVAGTETLGDEAIALEELYLGLRTLDGVAAERLPDRLRQAWTIAGWARQDAGRIILTAEGWLRLDALVASVR